jgi:hypothetical protein
MLIFLPDGCRPVMLVPGAGRFPPLPSDAHGEFQPHNCA